MDKLSMAIIAMEAHVACSNDRLRQAWEIIHAKLAEATQTSPSSAMVPCRMCVNGVISVSCRENCEPNSNACLKYYSAQHQ